jgi:hypothetical protein
MCFYQDDNPESGTLIDTGQDRAKKLEVMCTRFEDILEEYGTGPIDLLKIDIEGAEKMLFDSTSNRTLARATQITIEFHDHLMKPAALQSIIQRLESLGFLYINFAGGPDHADCLFLNVRTLLAAFHVRATLYVLCLKTYFALRRWHTRGDER